MSIHIVFQVPHHIRCLIVFGTKFYGKICFPEVPVILFSSPSPAIHILILTIQHRRTYRHGEFTAVPKHITVVTLWFLVANKVKVATPRIEPRPREELNPTVVRTFISVTQSRFAHVVNGSPDKVTKNVGMLVHQIPILCHLLREGLRTIHNAIRE